MTDQRHPDDLAHLRALVSAQQARLDRLERRRRAPRPFLPLALVALLVALVPLGLRAATPFTDLTGGVHDANIDAIYDAGVTRGCVPDAEYCPTDTVTREEMASFLARLGGLGTNPPVANAKTALTATDATNATNAQNAVNAQNAANAAQLGGQPASFYQPVGQPIASAVNASNAAMAANASALGGVPAAGYLRRDGDIEIWYSPYNLVVPVASAGVSARIVRGQVRVSATSTGTKNVHLPLDRPLRLFAGTTLAIKAIRTCYGIGGASAITSTDLEYTTATSIEFAHSDRTHRTSAGPRCYDVAVDPPAVADGPTYVNYYLAFANTADEVVFNGVRLTLTAVP